jgi:hypothetical protein
MSQRNTTAKRRRREMTRKDRMMKMRTKMGTRIPNYLLRTANSQ